MNNPHLVWTNCTVTIVVVTHEAIKLMVATYLDEGGHNGQ